ncbi:putative 30S ribosomal protein S5 [Corchorus capsularis]|uniref:Putative 30S ribosomal protein S5 n=1 Tax=Corchorus capsularis TaxID=210143 RepID=A0A1R3JJF1_COCAP|nr:putative 30S ribosomal protein S5 [Corchorus capsularis]
MEKEGAADDDNDKDDENDNDEEFDDMRVKDNILLEKLDAIDKKLDEKLAELDHTFGRVEAYLNTLEEEENEAWEVNQGENEAEKEEKTKSVSTSKRVELDPEEGRTGQKNLLSQPLEGSNSTFLGVETETFQDKLNEITFSVNQPQLLAKPTLSGNSASEGNMVDSSSPIEFLRCGNQDFLGIEKFLKFGCFNGGDSYDEWATMEPFFINDDACKFNNVAKMLRMQEESKVNFVHSKKLLHKHTTATTKALTLLAIHGVPSSKIGDFLPYLFNFILFLYVHIFRFCSYLIFALRWKDPP